ncbi:hypothetical protein [Chitiniphilus eburneus]|nr:hypothetical protein [Chitiniphilus eburneus]
MADLDPLAPRETPQHDPREAEDTVAYDSVDDAHDVDWFTLQVWE